MTDVRDVKDVNAGDPILPRHQLRVAIGLAGTQGAWFSELFATNTRSSGASLAFQLSAVVSGFTAFWAVGLYQAFGWTGPAVLFSIYGAVGLIAALLTPETFGPQRRAEIAELTRRPELTAGGLR